MIMRLVRPDTLTRRKPLGYLPKEDLIILITNSTKSGKGCGEEMHTSNKLKLKAA